MRIAIFTDTFSPQINGVTKTINRLLEYYESRGIEYIVFAPDFEDKDEEDSENVIRFKSHSFIFYRECRLSNPKYSVVEKMVDDFNPDLIHIITEYTIGRVGRKYAKKKNVPCATTYETDIPLYLKYYHASFLKGLAWVLYRHFHNVSDCTFTPSHYTQKRIESKGFTNVETWERGIELENFSPDFRDESWRKELGIDDKIVFLYVGRISPEKHVHIYIDAAKKINEKYMDKVHFLMVGGGPSDKEMREKAPDNMTFLGYLKGDELSKAYASSDVFLFPSPTETLGFVVLEAMASGLPVICCEEGGVSDSVIVGENGYLCRKANVDDFVESACKFIEQPEDISKMGKVSRRVASTKSWKNGFDKLYDSYERIIESKK